MVLAVFDVGVPRSLAVTRIVDDYSNAFWVELRAELVRHDPSITFEESSELFNVLDGNKDGLVTLDELTKR